MPSACDRDACVTLFDFSHCLHIQTFGFEEESRVFFVQPVTDERARGDRID